MAASHVMKIWQVFLISGLWLADSVAFGAGAVPASNHDVDFLRFSSTEEIVHYFRAHDIPTIVYPLKKHGEDYFVIASYPYSGADTIDLYCFRQYGAKQWRVEMLYFALGPKTRELTVVEKTSGLIVRDGGRELLRYSLPKPAAR